MTLALTFDIKGYFYFVNHNRLLPELQKKGFPLEYIKRTVRFLRHREAAVCIDGIWGEMKFEPYSSRTTNHVNTRGPDNRLLNS